MKMVTCQVTFEDDDGDVWITVLAGSVPTFRVDYKVLEVSGGRELVWGYLVHRDVLACGLPQAPVHVRLPLDKVQRLAGTMELEL